MKVLVFYPQYGFANRIRAIASAKILADFTGRKLMVNWDPTERDCNVAWEDLFVNRLERHPLPISSFNEGINLYDDSGSHDFYWDMPRQLAQNKADVIALRTFRSFRPKGMREEAFRKLKSLFYRSLEPVSSVQKAVERIYDRYFKDNYVVGVHIRRTDYFSYLLRDSRGVAPTERFIKKMKHIRKHNPDVKFFLATDDKNEERIIKDHLRDNVIVYEKEAVSRSSKKGMQDALIDWMLLSRTSKIIGSYRSSFNKEAGSVNMIDVETIPKRAMFLNLKAHYNLFRKSGFGKVFLYSYYYRKERLLNRIRKII